MPEAITSSEQAILRACALTGLQMIADVPFAELTEVREDVTPYFGEGNTGRPAWRVEFPKAALKFLTLPDLRDTYQRSFTVMLNSADGRLFYITSRYVGLPDPDMRPMPSCGSATEQLSDEEEVYSGYPAEDPKFFFLRALESIAKGGFGSPVQAKEMHAAYILHSSMGSDPKPAWAITLRGLPPFSARGREAESIPAWQRNHMRNIVDAMTGKVLSASNTPQPI
jgi:hypothetical protein